MPAPLRLRLDGAALTDNWRALAAMSGRAACGAAIKANGYGLGAADVAQWLAVAGCRDFFVATWREARAVAATGVSLSVLHGLRESDLPLAMAGIARPVLNTAAQVALWKAAGGGTCDVMVDTGMNRLGLSAADVSSGLLDGLVIDTLMSHLACADEDAAMNAAQRADFAALSGKTGARRMSLANSAGIALGTDYAFDLTRPGLSLYGGIQRRELEGRIRQVVTPEAQIIQRRCVPEGGKVGYNATWMAIMPTEVAILNIGYADGYWRGFSNKGLARAGGQVLPVIGRVSMDLTAINVTNAPELAEGDWVALDYTLPEASAVSGMSQYELLTGMGSRYDRVWS